MEDLQDHLGPRLRAQRVARGLSLESLATASGVSRSMVSEIERGRKMPTVLVLARLATALGVTVSRLLGESQPDRVIVMRREDQPSLPHPSGWTRQILSPNLPGVEFEFIRTLVAGGVVVGEFAGHAPGSCEYVAVETGSLRVTLDGSEYVLGAGDALYYASDSTHAFANASDAECVYYTVMQVVRSAHDPASQPGSAAGSNR